MSNCWAACLGGCSDKISREHIVSEGLFLGDEVFVQGFHWCSTEPKKIGLTNLTKKILCAKHNSDLSDADDAGIETFKAFREAFRLSDVRLQLKPRIWTVKKFKVDGWPFERWFVKTLINVAYEGGYLIGKDSTHVGKPSGSLVETAFGLRRFQPLAGLYFMGQFGEQIQSKDGVRILTLIQANCVIGALFHFRGLRHLLFLNTEGPGLGPLGVKGEDGKVVEPVANPMYHLRRLRFLVHNRLSHVVEIKW